MKWNNFSLSQSIIFIIHNHYQWVIIAKAQLQTSNFHCHSDIMFTKNIIMSYWYERVKSQGLETQQLWKLIETRKDK